MNCHYYYSNVSELSLWGTKYLGISSLYERFAMDAANGSLPAVSFVDPPFTLLDDGTGARRSSSRRYAQRGNFFCATVITTLAVSPHWKDTVLVINRDEWGGFFDHVAPAARDCPPTLSTQTW